MRKFMKIALGVFCTGVLLGGIGTGVAIVEYASMEYTGEHILGAENMKQETRDMAVEPEEGKQIQLRMSSYYYDGQIQYEPSVPENTVRFVVTYNPELVTMRPYYEAEYLDDGDWDREEAYQGTVGLNYFYSGSEFDLFMKNKDKILNELKHGKFGSYQTRGIESVEVHANPQMKGKIVYY